MVIPIT